MSGTLAAHPSRTEAQRTAARLNGRKGRGPATERGKLASSRNSLKHGLAGSGKHMAIDMEAEVAGESRALRAAFKPRDDFEERQLDRAALGAARLRALLLAEHDRIDTRYRDALKLWDERREAEVAALARDLPVSPALTLPRLRATCEGCDYLGDAWLALAEALETTGRIDDPGMELGLNLLGSSPLDRRRPPAADEFARLARLVGEEAEAAGRARDDLAEFIDQEVAELIERGAQLWEAHDRPDRDGAPRRAAFDPSPEGRLLARYIGESERLHRRALAEIARRRRESGRSAPARNEPEEAVGPPASDAEDSTGSTPPALPAPPATDLPPPPARNEPEPPAGSPAPPASTRAFLARNEPGAGPGADLQRLIEQVESRIGASLIEPGAPTPPVAVA